jgi:hypothetical protein
VQATTAAIRGQEKVLAFQNQERKVESRVLAMVNDRNLVRARKDVDTAQGTQVFPMVRERTVDKRR